MLILWCVFVARKKQPSTNIDMPKKKYSKECVYLRQRSRANGLIALYLDINAGGRRRSEYLRLYLVPEKTREDRAKNRETLKVANAIKAQRIIDVQREKQGLGSSGEHVLFFDFAEAFANKHTNAQGEVSAPWRSTIIRLHSYERHGNITFAQITQKWVEGFLRHLSMSLSRRGKNGQPLSPNSAKLYFTKLKAILNKAVAQGIISKSPASAVGNLKGVESTRQYLTIDELSRLAETPCRNSILRRAFLFSCFTGLRYSDVSALTWGEVHRQGDFTRIIFAQRKTGGLEYLDISPQAVMLMGDRAEPQALVFAGLPILTSANYTLSAWCRLAGIDKHITFHCARHTFAVMMLDLGVDIYTVSKLLGHRNLSTTQIYAKVLDKKKQAAAMLIPNILPNE